MRELLSLMKRLLFLAEDVEKNKDAVKEVRQELKETQRELKELRHELQNVSEGMTRMFYETQRLITEERHEREKLELRLQATPSSQAQLPMAVEEPQ